MAAPRVRQYISHLCAPMRPPGAEDLDAHWADFARHVRKMLCTTPPRGGGVRGPPPLWMVMVGGGGPMQAMSSTGLALDRLGGIVVERWRSRF